MKTKKPSAKISLSSRIWLRTPKETDCVEFLKLIRKSRSFHRGWVSPPKSKEEFSDYLDRCGRDDFIGFFICRKEDDAIVGVINVYNIVRYSFQNACLGYYIGAPFAGQGYMSEAIHIVLRTLFGELKLHRIEANIQPENKASRAIVKNAGFELEGYSARYLKIDGKWCDHERWALLAEDWLAKEHP